MSVDAAEAFVGSTNAPSSIINARAAPAIFVLLRAIFSPFS
jgi:hypothetical protein